MGTAFFHTTSNLLTLLSLSPPFDKEGGEMVGIRRIFFLVFSWTKRRASIALVVFVLRRAILLARHQA